MSSNNRSDICRLDHRLPSRYLPAFVDLSEITMSLTRSATVNFPWILLFPVMSSFIGKRRFLHVKGFFTEIVRILPLL